MKVNYAALSNALALLAINEASGEMASLADIEDAVTAYATENPTAIIRVMRAGFNVVYLTGEWSSADNPIVSNQPLAYYDGTQLQNGQATILLEEGKQIKVAGTSSVNIKIEISKDGSPSGDKQTLTATQAFTAWDNESGTQFVGTLKDLSSIFSNGAPYLSMVLVDNIPVVTLDLDQSPDPIG